MNAQPVLSDSEWQLVLELLEREWGELSSEIHHTDRTAMRHELHERKTLLDGMIHRVKETMAVPA